MGWGWFEHGGFMKRYSMLMSLIVLFACVSLRAAELEPKFAYAAGDAKGCGMFFVWKSDTGEADRGQEGIWLRADAEALGFGHPTRIGETKEVSLGTTADLEAGIDLRRSS